MQNFKYSQTFLFILLQLICGLAEEGDPPEGPVESYEHDGTLGIIPEIFDEEDEFDQNLFEGRAADEFIAVCNDKSKGDPDICEECPEVFTNSKNLSTFDGTCDALSEYNFKKLRYWQGKAFNKKTISEDSKTRVFFICLYAVCILCGVYLLVFRQFRLRTLWDKFADDPTQGMRSFRYERMKFKFDYDDPGGDPEDLRGYENWELYHSSEDDDISVDGFTGGINPEQVLAKKKRDNRRTQETGPNEWPWERKEYDFSRVPYREGMKKDMEDWEADEGSNFNSNI